MPSAVISDLHLGSRFCHAALALRFLRDLPPGCELVLNGDTVDHRPRHMTRDQSFVLAALCEASRERRVIWIRGNNDRHFQPKGSHDLRFSDSYALGRLLVVHGDAFEKILKRARPVTLVLRLVHSVFLYCGGQAQHHAFYAKRFPSLYGMLRRSVCRNAIDFARAHGYAAVACGHTHYTEQCEVNGIRYFNTGAWTETPVHYLWVDDGRMELRRVVGS